MLSGLARRLRREDDEPAQDTRPIVGFTLAGDDMPEIVARGRVSIDCDIGLREGDIVARPQAGRIVIDLVSDDADVGG